jgi:hypothetical protein
MRVACDVNGSVLHKGIEGREPCPGMSLAGSSHPVFAGLESLTCLSVQNAGPGFYQTFWCCAAFNLTESPRIADLIC